MSFKIDLRGVKELQDRFFTLEGEIKDKVQAKLNAFGQDTANDAKRLAPVDEGHLRNSISFVTEKFKVSIIVAADYAAFIEFGTRGFATQYVGSLPQDWQTFAAKFQGGSGGTFDELVMRIFNWVKRKKLRLEPKQYEQNDNGIISQFGKKENTKFRKPRKKKKQTITEGQQQLAYVIALKIIREGVKPHPFLYPAVEKNRLLLIQRLNAA